MTRLVPVAQHVNNRMNTVPQVRENNHTALIDASIGGARRGHNC
eukprot:CAMPEP_0198244780 /NCGR_PEP_ID=MMETSP1446-20131203/37413_1 /TAXON_ID=1461542 ORGANISM="Unidentified sp, Strain CCMP2111" /NCGR_SAMPLE_ID=MMETSP1446 /ASSEMBLY_ACC=CAM_ASM_001112 /LENGTH=43 /DNA_ID= /DNA_START= /DNA_END= /DNA_ORIENTATION=